jgi:immune inhibitor A
MPPAPDLEERIVRSKRKVFVEGSSLPAKATDKLLDARSFSLIIGRPPKTRAHTFGEAPAAGPVTGTRKALVLLVDFSDKAGAEPQAHFVELLFSVGTFGTGSMRDFYKEVSYGSLDVTGQVLGSGGPTAGWFRASQPKTVYTSGNYGFGSYPNNAQKLVEEVIDLAAPHVNFADYDNDGDGVVEALVVIAAGSGAEATGNVDDLWSHKWSIPNPRTYNNVRIENYFMASEDGRAGVMSHELGHLLMRWPDLYDTDYSSAGTGKWDLMAGGSWNNGGNTPAHPTAWCKAKVGWVNPTVVHNAAVAATIKPYATTAQVYKLPLGDADSKEYFLLSNRRKEDFDQHLPGEGLVIEHVDDNRTNNTDEDHYLVDIEQCDGRFDLNKNANKGDAGDAWPCNGKAFSAGSTPNTLAYDGTDHQISVSNIQQSGDDITADISVGGVAVKQWYTDQTVKYTFVHHTTQYAYVNLEGLGWRRIQAGAADGVTNMLSAFCEALTSGQKVHTYADDSNVYTMYLP